MRENPWPPLGNLITYLRPNNTQDTIFIRNLKGRLGKFVLPALPPRDRSRAQIRRGIYVRADGRNQAAAEIFGAAHLFLPAMFSLSGHGPASRRRPESGRMEHDPRPGRRRSRTQSGGLGKSARSGWLAAFR
jgi:hypothetical protein